MKPKEDLAVIFEQIGSIENRYMDWMRTIPDEELIAVVLRLRSSNEDKPRLGGQTK
jgi:hypothetical protein